MQMIRNLFKKRDKLAAVTNITKFPIFHFILIFAELGDRLKCNLLHHTFDTSNTSIVIKAQLHVF